MASLNNLSGFWGIGAFPSYQVPGYRIIRKVYSGPECESLIKEVVGDVGAGSVSLYWKIVSLGWGEGGQGRQEAKAR